MKKFFCAVMFVMLMSGISWAGSVITGKIKSVEPQIKWLSGQPNPQLLIVDGEAVAGCSGNNMLFYDDEPLLYDTAKEAVKSGATVKISYQPSGSDGRNTFVQSINQSVDCRVVGIGLSTTPVILAVEALILY